MSQSLKCSCYSNKFIVLVATNVAVILTSLMSQSLTMQLLFHQVHCLSSYKCSCYSNKFNVLVAKNVAVIPTSSLSQQLQMQLLFYQFQCLSTFKCNSQSKIFIMLSSGILDEVCFIRKCDTQQKFLSHQNSCPKLSIYVDNRNQFPLKYQRASCKSAIPI